MSYPYNVIVAGDDAVIAHLNDTTKALGRIDDAERWLERAVAFADQHGFSRILFRAEAALEALRADRPAVDARGAAAPPEVRDGLRAMRRAAALSGA